MNIVLLDPALYSSSRPSPNLGDQVISRAVYRELRLIFGESCTISSIPTHTPPGLSSLKLLKSADLVFVGGSNLLWFRLFPPASWRIGLSGVLLFRDLILFGVGWGGYQIKPSVYGRFICRHLLSSSYKHSVRDNFTQQIATDALYVPNVLNTCCPTLWHSLKQHHTNARTYRSEYCLFTLTDYERNHAIDHRFLHLISKRYGTSNLIFWPQGAGDLNYCRELGYTGFSLSRSLDSLISFLSTHSNTDYIGTRLHCGILCLEYYIRTLILSVDNRAAEIAKDTGLTVLPRSEYQAINHWIESGSNSQVQLPYTDIHAWKSQFSLK